MMNAAMKLPNDRAGERIDTLGAVIIAPDTFLDDRALLEQLHVRSDRDANKTHQED